MHGKFYAIIATSLQSSRMSKNATYETYNEYTRARTFVDNGVHRQFLHHGEYTGASGFEIQIHFIHLYEAATTTWLIKFCHHRLFTVLPIVSYERNEDESLK